MISHRGPMGRHTSDDEPAMQPTTTGYGPAMTALMAAAGVSPARLPEPPSLVAPVAPRVAANPDPDQERMLRRVEMAAGAAIDYDVDPDDIRARIEQGIADSLAYREVRKLIA